MNILLLIISIFLLTVAHFWKVKRQKQFIEIYEKPNEKYLLRGLSIGYIINLILPIKLGTLFRVIYPGKKMKNGVSFSFATIIIDIILDFLFLAFIYIILYFCNFTIRNNMIYYLIICIIILISIIIAFYFNKTIKNMILKIAMIFNDSIELRILKTFWFTITSFKDVIEKVSKIKLLFYTIIMWTLYLSSYACLGLYFEHLGYSFNFIDIFNMFYSVVGLSVPTLYFFKNASITNITVIIIYVIVPILLIYLYSIIYKNKKINNKKYVELLPHINIQDRLAFLVAYFNADNRDYFKNYIALNNDVAIIEDFSAGSNATTMLCCKENKTFFRKYSFGNDAKKLFDQIRWIQDHQNNIKLTTIENIKNSDNYCSYDMPYNPNAVTCFNYVHTVPVKESWPIIENALKDIDENLHTINIRKADPEYIEKYIETKVFDNLKKIENAFYIKPLLKYDNIFINGKKYKNLKYFYKYLNKEYLFDLFKYDQYADIHGDFTIENIICLKNNNKKDEYYIIDPNTGNLHDSPYLDYAKLLQSIHGGYEFLMNTKNVNIKDDRIDFIFTKSSIYDELFIMFKNYLDKKFDKKEVESIFFHEVIHWLRLLPYKIEKNGERVVLFYAGLIMVLNDIESMYLKK